MSEANTNQPVRQVKLELDKDTAQGRYANMAVLAHTKDEFVIDFGFAYPGQSPLINARVITSPSHAKALLRSLEENIRRYESHYGQISNTPLPITSSQVKN